MFPWVQLVLPEWCNILPNINNFLHVQPNVFPGPSVLYVLAPIAHYSTTLLLTVCMCSLMFFLGPVCPCVLALIAHYSTTHFLTVCMCSLMFSWARCAPICWNLLPVTLPHIFLLFACAAWCFPGPGVPLCAGTYCPLLYHTLSNCLNL